MKTRIISGIAMMPLLLIIYFGKTPLLIASFLVGIVGMREFFKAFNTIDIKPSYFIGVLSAIGLYAINILGGSESFYMFWLFLTVLLAQLYMFNMKERKLEDGLVTVMGVVYVVFFSFHIVLIDQLEVGSKLIWLALFSAFGSDICAYFTGMAIGKHRLCPTISPKKSVEGAIGGVLGSMVLCGIFGYVLTTLDLGFSYEIIKHCVGIGFVTSIISQIGDLTASIYKRKIGIKDYGTLIPGHGGILDRFDSVLFTAPTIYYYIKFMM